MDVEGGEDKEVVAKLTNLWSSGQVTDLVQ